MKRDKYKYQDKLVDNLYKSIYGEKPVVAAFTPNAGKSIITIKLLNKYFAENPNARIIFLGSTQKILSNQFYEHLEDIEAPVKAEFSFSRLRSNEDTQLKIALPQELINMENIKYDGVVLDEAHIAFKLIETKPNSMMSKILIDKKLTFLLLLTGSPAWFSARRGLYSIHYLSHECLSKYSDKLSSPCSLQLVKQMDCNLRNNLRTLMRAVKRNRDCTKKILVVARNQVEAKRLNQILTNEYKRKSKVSTSDSDPSSSFVDEFKCGELDTLVVVGRCRVGFSDNNLTLILDFQASLNTSLTQQLLCRAIRYKENTKKAYYRSIGPAANILDHLAHFELVKSLFSKKGFTQMVSIN